MNFAAPPVSKLPLEVQTAVDLMQNNPVWVETVTAIRAARGLSPNPGWEYLRMLDVSEIAVKFLPFVKCSGAMNAPPTAGRRIKVRLRYGEIKFGTVGVTTGWRPVLLLMLRTDSSGSSITLSDEDELLATQDDRGVYHYTPAGETQMKGRVGR